jgi:hypothetical protein
MSKGVLGSYFLFDGYFTDDTEMPYIARGRA